MDSTPASLLERVRQPGDQVAWNRFVELYFGPLLGWARALGLQEADAADLVQDVFATLLRVLPTFDLDQHKSFRGWLRTVLTNRWRDGMRHRALLPRQADEEALSGMVARADEGPFEETQYRRHLVSRALELLRDEFRPATWQAFSEAVVLSAQKDERLGGLLERLASRLGKPKPLNGSTAHTRRPRPAAIC